MSASGVKRPSYVSRERHGPISQAAAPLSTAQNTAGSGFPLILTDCRNGELRSEDSDRGCSRTDHSSPRLNYAARSRSISCANSSRNWLASRSGSQLAICGKTVCHIRASRSDHGISAAWRTRARRPASRLRTLSGSGVKVCCGAFSRPSSLPNRLSWAGPLGWPKRSTRSLIPADRSCPRVRLSNCRFGRRMGRLPDKRPTAGSPLAS